MNLIKELMKEYFPLILSTAISFFAIVATMYQTHTNKKVKTTELFFNAQLDAYQKLFIAIAEQEVDMQPAEQRDFRVLIHAAENARLVSTNRNSEAINDFCTVFIDYLIKSDIQDVEESLANKFLELKFILTTLLRDELFRFDTMKRKSDKYFKKA